MTQINDMINQMKNNLQVLDDEYNDSLFNNIPSLPKYAYGLMNIIPFPTSFNLLNGSTFNEGIINLPFPNTNSNLLFSKFETAFLPILPNKKYTCSLEMMSEEFTSHIIFIVQFYDKDKKFIQNAQSGRWSNSDSNIFEECIVPFLSVSNAAFCKIHVERINGPINDKIVYVRNILLGEGYGFIKPSMKRKIFSGNVTKIDNNGMFLLNTNNYKKQTIAAIYQKNTRDYNDYSKMGYNTLMFNQGSVATLKKASEAGMNCVMELSQYTNFKTQIAIPLNSLEKIIRDQVNSDYANSLLCYYFDNEAYSDYVLMRSICDIIRRNDLDRPIIMNCGNPGIARSYYFVDGVGGYTCSSLANESQNQVFVLNGIEGLNLPITIGVISGETDINICEDRIKTHKMYKGNFFAYYKDDVTTTPIEILPNILKE